MSNLQWTAEGRRDVDEIYDYVARRDRRPLTADRIVTELIEECRFLADSVFAGSIIGTHQPDLGENYRTFSHKRWVIVFQPLDDGIEVLRVLDGSRDLGRIFGA